MTAILWVLSLGAHLLFDALVSGRHGHASLGEATILFCLAVTCAVQRLAIQVRRGRMVVPAEPDMTGLA